jgi:protein phosphatase PTC1
VFDGHSGRVAATTAAELLTEEVSRLTSVPKSDIPLGFRNAFISANHKLEELAVPDGCTCAALFVRNDTAFVAAVGDSRVVRVTSQRAQRITTDAKPTNRDEYERLRAAGLTINADGRIGRKLGVARAFGDFWVGETVFVAPDVASFAIGDDDDAVIIACDGVWDVMTDQSAADIYGRCRDPIEAARTIKSEALKMGSTDNVSVMCIDLRPLPGSEAEGE